MAESTGLLNLHTGNRITSSNLVLSAKKVLQKFLRDLFGSLSLSKRPKGVGEFFPRAPLGLSRRDWGLKV